MASRSSSSCTQKACHQCQFVCTLGNEHPLHKCLKRHSSSSTQKKNARYIISTCPGTCSHLWREPRVGVRLRLRGHGLRCSPWFAYVFIAVCDPTGALLARVRCVGWRDARVGVRVRPRGQGLRIRSSLFGAFFVLIAVCDPP